VMILHTRARAHLRQAAGAPRRGSRGTGDP
jgi:hypothetical protein